ncbi:MAG: TonB-dependent receptor plug domain-containing protein, partial [Candidatus Omnitrophota bacterium]
MKKLFLFIFLMGGICCISKADDTRDLGQIVVTPFRYQGSIVEASGDVQVITSQDIQGSSAKTAIDLLRPLAGVNVSDWYGNGTRTAVDMAGFGEQAFLNTLVLVDGRRVNDVDLSGSDWSIIPVSEIERIEIVRSGSGAVLYGDNASGGVINIITKKGVGKPQVQVETSYGSYQYNDQRLSLNGSQDKLSYRVSGGRQSTQGYRENSFSQSEDLSARLGYEATDRLTWRFDTAWHGAEYGMPGALWQTQMDQDSRRYARYGRDHAINSDYYYLGGVTTDFNEFGKLDIDA